MVVGGRNGDPGRTAGCGDVRCVCVGVGVVLKSFIIEVCMMFIFV